uniref:Uncharacterized protein n=1 Tax=Salix viminalis TaxID=40686 RepID=A0A6N2LKS6_SALVM
MGGQILNFSLIIEIIIFSSSYPGQNPINLGGVQANAEVQRKGDARRTQQQATILHLILAKRPRKVCLVNPRVSLFISIGHTIVSVTFDVGYLTLDLPPVIEMRDGEGTHRILGRKARFAIRWGSCLAPVHSYSARRMGVLAGIVIISTFECLYCDWFCQKLVVNILQEEFNSRGTLLEFPTKMRKYLL